MATTFDSHSATLSAIRARYRTLSTHNWERMTDLLVALDPRLPRAGAEHLAHNWHTCNPESPIREQVNAIREQRYQTSRKLYARQKSECDRAEHARHIRDAQVGRYLWCEPCQQAA